MATLTLSFLGGFGAALDGASISTFDSDKVRALLAYLATESDRAHRRDSLAALLWPDYPERSARTNLRNALANLRKAIHDQEAATPCLEISRATLRFCPNSQTRVDVLVVDEVARRLATAELPSESLAGVVDLYKGDFLEGFTLADSAEFDDWSAVTRQRLRHQLGSILQRLIDQLTAEGEIDAAVVQARRLVTLEPWLESAQRALMRLLAYAGQRSAALLQYEACRTALGEELGVEPDAETVALYEKIRSGEVQARKGDARPTAVGRPGQAAEKRHNLPAQLTPLIGREAELAQLGAYLHDPACRLLTLVGPGGIGKTRLALEACARQVDHFDHGVFLVPLAAVGTADGLVPAIARALSFAFRGESTSRIVGGIVETPQAQLLAYLRGKAMLLLLDNAEHLLDGPSPVGDIRETVLALLNSAPGLTILVTTRARLDMQGEQLLPLRGLAHGERWLGPPTEPPLSAGMQLIVEGARRVLPGFAISDRNAEPVARICRIVQGMPLAILLAAAWVTVLSPGEIADQLSEGADSALDLLVADWGDVPERHRSLRKVFEGSWTLLSPDEQTAFAALSVFHGGFTWPAARAVTSVSLPTLRALVSKSMVHVNEGRYDLHPLLLQFAAERLSVSTDHGAARWRHCQYYAVRVQTWSRSLKGEEDSAALAEMTAEIANVEAAWAWAVSAGDVSYLDAMADGLGLYHRRRALLRDGERLFMMAVTALSRSDNAVGDAAKLQACPLVRFLAWQAYFSHRTADKRSLVERGNTLLALTDASDEDAFACRGLLLLQAAGVAMADRDREHALALSLEAHRLFQGLDSRWWEALSLSYAYEAAWALGRFAEAYRLSDASLDLFRCLGNAWEVARALFRTGSALMRQGELDRAEALWKEAAEELRKVGEKRDVARALFYLGAACYRSGRFSDALRSMTEAYDLASYLGLDELACEMGIMIAGARCLLGDYAAAIAFAEPQIRAADAAGDVRAGGDYLTLVAGVDLVEGRVDDAYTRCQRAVELLAGHVADEEAMAKSILGLIELRLGHRDAAHRRLKEVLAFSERTNAFMALYYALPIAASLLAESGQVERAVAIYALARDRFAFVANSQWFEDVVGRSLAAIARVALPTERIAAAEAQGRGLDLRETLASLLETL